MVFATKCTDREFQRHLMDYLGMAYDIQINPGPSHWPDAEVEATEIYETTRVVCDYRVKYTLYISDEITGAGMLLTERIG